MGRIIKIIESVKKKTKEKISLYKAIIGIGAPWNMWRPFFFFPFFCFSKN